MIKNFNLSITTDQLLEMHSKKAVELILGLEINWFIQALLEWSKSKGITPDIISAGMESNITKILSAKNMRDKFSEINMFRIGVYHEFNKHFDLQADIFVETKDS